MVKRIVVIGPESTGKSSLCQQLATHFKSVWVREYARDYLLKHGTDYNFDDLRNITTGQLKAEDEAAMLLQDSENNSLLFIDTDLYVIKVWSEYVFNRCDNAVLTQIAIRKYDLYLLCDTDIPWVKDELREYPDLLQREKLFHFYKDAMINQTVPWMQINGTYEQRFSKAVDAVKALL